MSTTVGPRTPDVWRMLRAVNRRVAVCVLERGRGSHGSVLLLATTGRRPGQPRVTPLQYEEVDGVIYVASARGQRADWFQNALARPEPGSTDDIEGRQPFSQVRPPLSLPGGCTYQVQSSTAPIRALTCLNTDKPEKVSVDRG